MPALNKTLLIGNIVRDPEMRYTPNGTALCNITLATTRKYKSGNEYKEETCFVDITVWGKTGENCAQYLAKGDPVFVEGRLKLDQWETDGKKRSKLKVVAENVQFLSKRSENVKEKAEPEIPGHSEDTIPF